MENVLEILQNSLRHNHFLKAIYSSNFQTILDGIGPFTVLAPVDEAFLNLPDDVFNKLLENQDQLNMMVGQHVFTGRYDEKDLRDTDEIITMDNKNLAIELHGEGLIVGGAKIIESDIECSNGIIHRVDLVLL
ncbi:MAG: fasciclin domain-containing protein [Patescibacteria group bacterium]